MVRTRAQAAQGTKEEPKAEAANPATKSKSTAKAPKAAQKNTSSKKRKADSAAEKPSQEPVEKTEEEKHPVKQARTSKSPVAKSKQPAKTPKVSNPKIEKLLDKYGQKPLTDVGLSSPDSYSSETVLAHIFNAILSSARISHEIAAHTLRCLIKANYHNLESLRKSTWEARTEVLTEGGYTHYREKTATALGELAEMLEDKYDGDVMKFVQVAAKGDAKKVQKELGARLKEIKGMGPLGVDIFFGTAQAIIPEIAPFISSRDIKAVGEIGLDTDLTKLYKEVGQDATNMARFSAALTRIRLDKHVPEFT